MEKAALSCFPCVCWTSFLFCFQSFSQDMDQVLRETISINEQIYFGPLASWYWKIDAFELWCGRMLLRVPWTAGRSNHSILKEISPEYSLKGLMLKLKLQYFGHLMWRVNSLEKTLMLGKIEGKRRRRQQRIRWLDIITDSTDMNLSKLQETVEDRGAWRAVVHGMKKSQTRQQMNNNFGPCFTQSLFHPLLPLAIGHTNYPSLSTVLGAFVVGKVDRWKTFTNLPIYLISTKDTQSLSS